MLARRGATGLGREGGGEGAPSQKTCRAPQTEPLAEGGFVLRRLVTVAVCGCARSPARRPRRSRSASRSASKAGRRPSSAPRSRPSTPAERAPGARRRQPGRRVLLRPHGELVRQLRQPDRPLPGRGQHGWVFKVNGVSPPVGADQVALKDGDTVLWYWAEFGSTGGPPTLSRCSACRPTATSCPPERRRREDAGARDAAGRRAERARRRAGSRLRRAAHGPGPGNARGRRALERCPVRPAPPRGSSPLVLVARRLRRRSGRAAARRRSG